MDGKATMEASCGPWNHLRNGTEARYLGLFLFCFRDCRDKILPRTKIASRKGRQASLLLSACSVVKMLPAGMSDYYLIFSIRASSRYEHEL